MARYTPEEKLVLLAGMASGRDSIWSRMPGTVESLSARGLVEMSRQEGANGTVESIPLGLSAAGVTEARKLQDSSHS